MVEVCLPEFVVGIMLISSLIVGLAIGLEIGYRRRKHEGKKDSSICDVVDN
jgi:hypothetical protein